MNDEEKQMIKPGSAEDVTLAVLLIIVLFGIVIGLFLFVAFNFDPAVERGSLPWSF